jgi:5'(3')-deoxyribonucleotidase
MRIFVDMDGVIVDFEGFKKTTGLGSEQVKIMPSAYRHMNPLPGALDGVRSLIGMGHDVWIATKPPTGIPHAYADKVAWILEYLPELKRKIVLTHDKSLLRGDVLIDDRPHKANARNFAGHVITFGLGVDWWEVLRLIKLFPTTARITR